MKQSAKSMTGKLINAFLKGRWVTIRGIHVFINDAGNIVAGPSNLCGKNIEDLKNGSESEDAENNGLPLDELDTENLPSNLIKDKLDKKGLTTVEKVMEYQGFNGLPSVVNQKDFDKFIKEGGIELSRGISAHSMEELQSYVDKMKYQDFYISGEYSSYFGRGLYCFGGKSLEFAWDYVKGAGDVLQLGLTKDAKILEVKLTESKGIKESLKPYVSLMRLSEHDIDRVLKENSSFISSMEENGIKLPKLSKSSYLDLDKRNEYTYAVTKEVFKYAKGNLSKEDLKEVIQATQDPNSLTNDTRVAVARGYDAIKYTQDYVDKYSSNGKQEIWVVLNRNKLVINDDASDYSDMME